MVHKLHFTEIHNTDALHALADEWRSLHASSPWAHPFNSFGFVSAWWDTFHQDKQLVVVAARTAEGALRLIAPMFAAATQPTDLLMIGDPRADYMSPLIDAGTPDAFDAFLVWLHGQRRWNSLQIRYMPTGDSDGRTLSNSYTSDAAWLRKVGCWGRFGSPLIVKREHSMHPYIDHERLREFQGLLERKNYARQIRRLERAGHLEFKILSHSDEVLPLLDELFEQHVGQFELKGRVSLFLQQENRDFYRRLVPAAAQDGLLQMHALCFDDRLIAGDLSFLCKKTLYSYKSAYAPEFGGRRPGKLLLAYMIREAHRNSHAGIDLLKGCEPYKLDFCSEVRRTWTIKVYHRRWSRLREHLGRRRAAALC